MLNLATVTPKALWEGSTKEESQETCQVLSSIIAFGKKGRVEQTNVLSDSSFWQLRYFSHSLLLLNPLLVIKYGVYLIYYEIATCVKVFNVFLTIAFG